VCLFDFHIKYIFLQWVFAVEQPDQTKSSSAQQRSTIKATTPRFFMENQAAPAKVPAKAAECQNDHNPIK
jgi:hypothetical protein